MGNARARERFRVAVATAALCLGSAIPALSGEGATRTVELIADKDNKFKFPSGQTGPLELKSGELVNFHITSHFGGEKARDGAVHSFAVKKLREKDPAWSVRLKEGAQEFTLRAPGPGKYLIECTVECGPGHDKMNMQMVVVK